MKEELGKKDNFFLAPFLVGGILGAGLALMLAPKPGKELRADIRNLATRTKERVSKSIDQGKSLYAGGRTAVTSALDAGRAAYLEEKGKFHAAS